MERLFSHYGNDGRGHLLGSFVVPRLYTWEITYDIQEIKPSAVAIILMLDYSAYDIKHYPIVSIIEVLGTKSETRWPSDSSWFFLPDNQEPPHPDP